MNVCFQEQGWPLASLLNICTENVEPGATAEKSKPEQRDTSKSRFLKMKQNLDDKSEQKSGQGSMPDGSKEPIWDVKLGFPKQDNVVPIPKDLTTGHLMTMVPTMRKQAMKNLILRELMTRRQMMKFPKMMKSLVAWRSERNHQCYYNPASCF